MMDVAFDPLFDRHGGLNHQHLLVHARVRDAEKTVDFVKDWLYRLVAAVDMKILIEPAAVKCDLIGNEGVTGFVCLQTSHASIHLWNKSPVPYLRMDIYSCKAFDPVRVITLIKEFDPFSYSTTLIDRN